MLVYKLTDQNMQTYEGCQWEIGVKKITNGEGDLCSVGWLHCYVDPRLAVLMNPCHGNYHPARIFEATASGQCKTPDQSKSGYTEMTLIREIEAPVFTTEKRIRFAILCAKAVYKEQSFQTWVDNWLSGKNRTASAAANANAAAARANADLAPNAAAYAAAAAEFASAADAYAANAAAYAAAEFAAAADAYAAAADAKLDLLSIIDEAMRDEL